MLWGRSKMPINIEFSAFSAFFPLSGFTRKVYENFMKENERKIWGNR